MLLVMMVGIGSTADDDATTATSAAGTTMLFEIQFVAVESWIDIRLEAFLFTLFHETENGFSYKIYFI